MMIEWLLELLGGRPAGSAPCEDQVDALAALATRHRVPAEALEAWQTRETSAAWPPPPQSLLVVAREAKLRSLGNAVWSARLGARLSDAGIPFIALKGPALSAHIYGDPSRRVTRDIDILVAPDRFGATVEVAEALGWRMPADWQRIRRIVRSFDLELLGGTPLQPMLDVHGQFFGSHMHSPSIGEVPTVDVALGGGSVPTLAPAAQIAYVALHGAKHLWFRLIWLTDLAELLDRNELPPDEIVRCARAWRAEAALQAGVHLCRTHLGREFPKFPSSCRAMSGRAKMIAKWASARLAAGPDARETLRWHVQERLVSDAVTRALVHSALDFLRPAEIDVRALGPERAVIAHYLSRPLFWMRRRFSP